MKRFVYTFAVGQGKSIILGEFAKRIKEFDANLKIAWVVPRPLTMQTKRYALNNAEVKQAMRSNRMEEKFPGYDVYIQDETYTKPGYIVISLSEEAYQRLGNLLPTGQKQLEAPL